MGKSNFNRGSKSNKEGGRGRGSSRSASKSSSTTSKTSEMKFTPQINGQSVGASYATIKESICHKIQKTPSQFPDGFDLAQSIRDGELVNLKKEKPTRDLAKHADPERKKVLQDGLDIEYKIVFNKWHTRCANLEANQTTAYSMIFDQYCTRVMQARIEEHPDFSTKIVNNPIQLLETIKTCIQQTVRAQYPLVSATESLKVFLKSSWITSNDSSSNGTSSSPKWDPRYSIILLRLPKSTPAPLSQFKRNSLTVVSSDGTPIYF